MATIMLIHGAWHGSWCWSEVRPALEAYGHRVLTPDLRGSGEDPDGVPDQPLSCWADQIAALVAAEPEPVVLVGHSRGGLVISEVAERLPERLCLLVYVAAFLLQDGEALQDIAQGAENAERFGAAFALKDSMLHFSDDRAREFFYRRSPLDFVRTAQERLCPEPAAAFVTPIHVTKARFGSVPRAYVECIDDQAIPLATQRAMQATMPCATVVTLDADHSPFFSAPRALVAALERCIDEVTRKDA